MSELEPDASNGPRKSRDRIAASKAIVLWRPAACYSDDPNDSGDVLVGTRDELDTAGALNDDITWPFSGGAVYRDWLKPNGDTPAATYRRIVRRDKVSVERAQRALARIEGWTPVAVQ